MTFVADLSGTDRGGPHRVATDGFASAPDFDSLIGNAADVFNELVGPTNFCFWLIDNCVPGQAHPNIAGAFDPQGPLAAEMTAGSGSAPITLSTAEVPFGAATGAIPLTAFGSCLGTILLTETIQEDQRETIAHVAQVLAFACHAHLASKDLAQLSQRQSIRADELQVAETIQKSLLPTDIPAFAGWSMAAHYEPARVIGGDLYDFIPLPNELLGIVLGDASDKGTPAALMMATTRALLRASAQRLIMPARVLAQVNDDLASQIPPGMFVTCFFGLLDTATGRFRYANAGHCAPVINGPDGVNLLTARGWPLGMLPGKSYDEGEIVLLPGQALVLYSDGLTESMDSTGTLFGTERILETVSATTNGVGALANLVERRLQFAGNATHEDDDITIVTLFRDPLPSDTEDMTLTLRQIDDFLVPSSGDNERAAADRVIASISDLDLTQTQRDRLHTAVAEAVMNASEHGNHFRPDLSVQVVTTETADELIVQILDAGKSGSISQPHQPNLEAKLAGEQSPRGWGLFLISKMVDRFEVKELPAGNCVELGMRLGSRSAASQQREHEVNHG